MNSKWMILSMSLFWMACSGSSTEKPIDLDGKWNALWIADPESFPQIEELTQFNMNGQFLFEDEKLTVVAEGFPGCIFGLFFK